MFGNDVTDTNAIITGLTNGTTYYIWIKAKKSGGIDNFGAVANGIPVPIPYSPDAVTIIPGNSQLSLSWTAVTYATAYEVWYSTSKYKSSALKFGADVTGTSITLAGLANDYTFYIWLKSKNSAGTSDLGEAASGIPVASVIIPKDPDAPTVNADDSQLLLYWNAVSGATEYELWYNTTDDTGTAIRFGNDLTNTSAILTGLTNGSPYYVWLKVKNRKGTSDFGKLTTGGTPAARSASTPTITFKGEELVGIPTDTSIVINIVPDKMIVYHFQYGTSPGNYS